MRATLRHFDSWLVHNSPIFSYRTLPLCIDKYLHILRRNLLLIDCDSSQRKRQLIHSILQADG